MAKLKVGMILDSHFPPDPRVESEARILINAGYDVALFALSSERDKKQEENVDGIKVIRYYLNDIYYKKLSPLVYTFPFYNMILKKTITSFISNNNFDVLHVHDMAIAGLVFQINKKFRLPIILDLHENRPEIMQTYSHVNSGLGKFLINVDKWKELQNKFIKKADRVIVVTEEAKSNILNQLDITNDKVTALPNTVEYPDFPNQKRDENLIKRFSDGFKVLYVGATGIRRGIDTAIEATSILKEKIPVLKLIIVGKSRDDDYLMKLSRKLGIEEFVSFEGWQNFNLFPSYISISDVCISPLKRNKHHDTTLANKIFQYMSLAKPVIVSNCPSQANIVSTTGAGLIHEASNADDLATKIEYIYNHPAEAKIMGEKGLLSIKEKYNWNKVSSNLLKIYETIN